MKADLSLAERQRIARQEQSEIRAALVRRHVDVLDEQHAIEASQVALDIRTAPVFKALADRMKG